MLPALSVAGLPALSLLSSMQRLPVLLVAHVLQIGQTYFTKRFNMFLTGDCGEMSGIRT